MKKKDLKKTRESSIKDLKKKVLELKKDVAVSYANRYAGKSKSVMEVKNLRKDIAQIMTIIREKEIIEEIRSEKKGVKTKAK